VSVQRRALAAAEFPAVLAEGRKAPPAPRRRRRGVTLFLPISPLLAALGPLVFLASPPARTLPASRRLKAAAALGATLLALSGADIAVETRHVLIRIRIL
jgi:hypothetical protein